VKLSIIAIAPWLCSEHDQSSGSFGVVVRCVTILAPTHAKAAKVSLDGLCRCVDLHRGFLDGYGTIGGDMRSMGLMLKAEIPEMQFPLPDEPPDTLTILDFLEFVAASIGKPIEGKRGRL